MDDAYSSVCRFCLLVHSKTPEEVSSCEKESIELENSEDVSNKIGAKVNRRGVSSQKVVLIDPILKEEDAYHDDSRRWYNKAIERYHESKDNVE